MVFKNVNGLPDKNKKHFQKLTVLRYDINKEGIAYEG